MLKIKDKKGRLKYVLRDEDEEPIGIDEVIIADAQKKEKEKKIKKENQDAKPN